jgi:DNA repair protein RecN (Recombination protein N)
LHHLRGSLQREMTHEPRLGEVDALLDSAAIQLDEAFAMLERIRDDLDLDPDALDALERRLARVQDLARKHRVAPDGWRRIAMSLARELDTLADADERLQRTSSATSPRPMPHGPRPPQSSQPRGARQAMRLPSPWRH